MTKYFALTALAFSLLTGCATAPSVGSAPALAKDGMLVDGKGMTLYVFDNDLVNSGKSSCNGDCAVKWPPFFGKSGDRPVGDYTLVARNDGRLQWAFRGKPLYYWPEDHEPGDKYGDNYEKVWHIVPPTASFTNAPARAGSGRTDGY